MDEFSDLQKGLTSPATRHFAIVPSDTTDLPIVPRMIYCQSAGDVVIRDEEGVDLTYSLMTGDRLEFRGVRVLNTGTSGLFYGWS